MIKGLTTTVVSACLAGGVGIGLFFVKHEVKEQEARLAELNQEIQRNQEEIHVLKAEWSYLNDPARLRQLSEKFLGMRVMGPSQISSLANLQRDAAPMVAKAEPAKPTIQKPEAPKALAKAEPAKPAPAVKILAAAPVAAPKPTGFSPAPLPVKAPPVAAVQSAAPPPPSRSIVIQSPALAQTQAPAGEVR